jgi:hypothetical protein
MLNAGMVQASATSSPVPLNSLNVIISYYLTLSNLCSYVVGLSNVWSIRLTSFSYTKHKFKYGHSLSQTV